MKLDSLLFDAVLNVTYRVDEVLEKIAEKPLHALYEENKKRAMRDPIYRSIEKRRRADSPPGAVTMYSENMTHDDWDTQMEIYHALELNPWWRDVLREMKHSPVSGVVYRGKNAWERARQGWAETDVISLDVVLCRTLGAQLEYMAEHSHGWPQSKKYPKFKDWTAALRHHGQALSAYAVGDQLPDGATGKEMLEEQDRLREEAGKSLKWVSKNLGSLWV